MLLSNNWAQDIIIYFLYRTWKFFAELIEYACINTQKSRALIREKLHPCQRTKTWWTWRVSFQPSLKKTACSSQDWLAEMTFVMMSLPLRWLVEIWCMIAQLTGSQRCSCEALLPFPTLPLEHPAELAPRLTSLPCFTLATKASKTKNSNFKHRVTWQGPKRLLA